MCVNLNAMTKLLKKQVWDRRVYFGLQFKHRVHCVGLNVGEEQGAAGHMALSVGEQKEMDLARCPLSWKSH